MKNKTFRVIFSHVYNIKTKSREEAEQKAYNLFVEELPQPVEFGVDVEEKGVDY